MLLFSDHLYRLINAITQPIQRLIPSLDNVEERRKRLLVVGALLLTLPVFIISTIIVVLRQDHLGLLMDGGTLCISLVSLLVLLRVRNGIWVYRLMTLSVTLLLAYNIVTGPDGQNSIMWALVYPPIMFIIIGTPEGLFWYIPSVLAGSALLIFPQTFGAYSYPVDTRVIFSALFFIFTGFSIGFELLRWYFYVTLERQQLELKDALENVRTLSGLLPICSVCKKIRDDQGYWNQLESYISTETGVKFSHGMCGDCFREFYPDIYAKRKAHKVDKKKSPLSQIDKP